MNRRGFLSLLATTPLVAVPQLAELLAPTRTIFLPPAGGWVSSGGNRLLTMKELVREWSRLIAVQIDVEALELAGISKGDIITIDGVFKA